MARHRLKSLRTQLAGELQGVSKPSAFVQELKGKHAADGICPSASCSPPWEHGSFKTPFKPEPPSHKQASIKLMEHICKKLLYTLKTKNKSL